MKKILVVLAVLAMASAAQAAVLATWNFQGSNSSLWGEAAPIAGANLGTGIGSAALTFGTGFTATSSGNNLRGNGTTWGGVSRTIAVGDSSYVQLLLTAASLYTLTVQSVDARMDGSSTGIGGSERWAANADGGAYSFVIAAGTTANGTLRSFDVTDTAGSSVGLRYFASPTAAGGSWGFSGTTGTAPASQSIVVNGTTTSIPEPATMGLLGLGALAMVLRRKMKK
jgi:hypothetical protein